MRNYELLYVLKPTLTEEEVLNKVNFMREVLEKNGAQIVSTLEMGTRKLAYEVQKWEKLAEAAKPKAEAKPAEEAPKAEETPAQEAAPTTEEA